MLPGLHDLTTMIDYLDPIRQNPLIFKEKCRASPTMRNEVVENLFFIAPKPHCEHYSQLLFYHHRSKSPAHQNSGTLGRILLARIGRAHVTTCQKFAIHPLLLYIEMIFVAAIQNGQ